MRLWADPNLPSVEVSYQWAQPGAKFYLGRTPFRSHVWETAFRDSPYEGLGEVDDRLERNYRGPLQPGPGVTLDTPEEWLRTGVPTGYVPKECCGQALQRGVIQVSTPDLTDFFVDPHSPFLVTQRQVERPDSFDLAREVLCVQVSIPDSEDLADSAYVVQVTNPDTEDLADSAEVLQVSTPEVGNLAWETLILEVSTPEIKPSLWIEQEQSFGVIV